MVGVAWREVRREYFWLCDYHELSTSAGEDRHRKTTHDAWYLSRYLICRWGEGAGSPGTQPDGRTTISPFFPATHASATQVALEHHTFSPLLSLASLVPHPELASETLGGRLRRDCASLCTLDELLHLI